MKLQTKDRYPASSDVVIKMFSDPDYHVKKMNKLGIKHEILSSNTAGDEFTIKAKRYMPIDASGAVKKVLGETTEVTNTESWHVSNKTGAVAVETKGVPLKMSCTGKMVDVGDECDVIYDWEINAKIPLVGGALEKFVAGDMQKSQAKELAVAHTLLADYK